MTALLRRAPCCVAFALTMICWSFSITTYARAAFECGGRAVLRLNGYALDAAAVETLFDTQARLPSAVKFGGRTTGKLSKMRRSVDPVPPLYCWCTAMRP